MADPSEWYKKKYDYDVAACTPNDPRILYDIDWEEGSIPLSGQRILGPVAAFIGGASIHFLTNLNHRRPLYAGIHMYFIYGTSFALIAYYARKRIDAYTAQRDAIYRHYVQLHPEDFTPPPRKKYGEILLPWMPIR